MAFHSFVKYEHIDLYREAFFTANFMKYSLTFLFEVILYMYTKLY